MGDSNARNEKMSSVVVERLELGESPVCVARSTGLDAVDLVRAIARVGLDDGGPGLEQGSAGRTRLSRPAIDGALAAWLPDASRPTRLALAAGLLQVLDVWDASHSAAQEADDLGERSTAAYWHLIAHRREPDPGNALYWTRRVGRHSIHEGLAEEARAVLASSPEGRSWLDLLLPGGRWSPSAMIDLATQARPGTSLEGIARSLQRLEMVALLDASLKAADGDPARGVARLP